MKAINWLTSLFSFLFLSTTLLSTAQSMPDEAITGSVKGVVLDGTLNEPIPYATVVINDSANQVVTGGITNDDGSFILEKIPEGNYTFKVQFIGYETYTKAITINRTNRDWNLGTLKIAAIASELDEVNIVAERTTIEQQIDRKVINVGKDLTTAGATASDIMNNIPSVSVDQQSGALTLRGNSNVRVMVDGKLSNIPAAQLLKQIPSTSIKKIELITNPSAKYNPEGMSGIINIVLHKNVNIGFNGDVNVGLSYEKHPKFNSGMNLNYRNGKFNLYANYSNNFSLNQNYGNIYRPNDGSRQLFNFLDDSKSHLLKTGLDFYLNDKNTLSFFTSQNWYAGSTTGDIGILYPSADRNQTQLFKSVNDNTSGQYNFDYKLAFDKEGHNIELEVDHNIYSGNEDADFKFTGASPIDNYMDFVDTERDRTTVNLDYVNPLAEDAKLEAGLQAILFNTDIDYASTGKSYNSQGVLVPTRSTQFEYSRNIYSAYLTYGKTFEKWSYQMGARLENVNVKADTNTVRAFTNDYIQVYPSAYLTYNPSEKNQYQVSYSRRVDRPGVGQVNPIRQWSTPLLTNYGNVDLEPQFTNSIELNYTHKLEKGSVTGGVFYRIIQDEINQAVFVDRFNLDKSVLTFDNFDNTSAYGFELSSNYKPFEWWSFNASFDIYNQTQKGISEVLDPSTSNPTADDILLVTREVDNTAYNVRMSNNFTVTQKFTLSAFGFYRGSNEGLQFKSKPMYFVNVGARYELWDGKSTFSLNYNDIFNTMRARFTATYPYEQIGQFNWESQTIFVGLNYRFGDSQYRAKRRKQRDANEKSGGGVF
ncbi:TonB-dependent receptor domain-containing protein [Leeuwenhoekiella sp. A2]|uniref:TonB-dependent receptor domain-containing protein n=1 Tax=Leeuwenhoekiella sp. A2 TaxID=3141460 RepID=UPI003A813CE3